MAIIDSINQIRQLKQTKNQFESDIYEYKLKLFNISEREKKLSEQIYISPERLKKIQELRSEIQKLKVRIKEIDIALQRNTTRAERDKLLQERSALAEKAKVLLEKLAALDGNISDEQLKLEKEKADTTVKLAQVQQLYNGFLPDFNGTLEAFFNDNTIDLLTQAKDDFIPCMLVPVKLETKFHAKSDGTKELWVRFYPDTIAITTHEDGVMEEEYNDGKAYWSALFIAQDNEDDKKDAWQKLIDIYGAPRSAWIAKQTRPENFDILAPGSPVEDLMFPTVAEFKPASWTMPPKSKIMPDRFVVTMWAGGKKVDHAIGRTIPDPLIVGPDPLATDEAFDQTPEGELNLGEGFDWITDFDKAIEIGMGIKIPLESPYDTRGFDKVIVLGLRWTMDADDGALAVSNLIHEHHYSPSGFSLVKQGTATNNTDNATSDYTENEAYNNLSYYTENETPLINEETEFYKISDGQRLAKYLGIPLTELTNIKNADLHEYAEAIAMNRAMYPGTLGYFLDTMLEPVLPENKIYTIRSFFTNNVTGRGPVAAIRVGDQPYGILPASDLKSWYTDAKENYNIFQLERVLKLFRSEWEKLLPGVSHFGQNSNPTEILLDVLGLHPNSVKHHKRMGYHRDYLKNLDDFKGGGKYFTDLLENVINNVSFNHLLADWGYNPKDSEGNYKKTPHFLEIVYQHFFTTLNGSNLIENKTLSEQNILSPLFNETNYISWLAGVKSISTLEKQDFGVDGVTAPNSLLYLMLRHALLQQLYDSTGHFYLMQKIDLPRYKRAKDFYNIKTMQEPVKWELMKAKVNLIQPNSNNTLAVADHLFDLSVTNPAEVAHLSEVREALTFLSTVSTAGLERAFIEHLDTLTYRLDAWETGMISDRLVTLRETNTDRNPGPHDGVYVGAYGYLENVVPDKESKTVVPNESLPEQLRDKDNPIYDSKENGGFVHTPSLNHAYAAALLRNAYLTHADSDEKELMNINISSNRVRKAIAMIEGIRNSQPIEVLLGYQFERAMHDYTIDEGINLNQYILDFRMKFPVKRQPIPQAGNNTAESQEAIDDVSVTNGIAFAETETAYPYGISSLPSSGSIKDAVLAIKDELNDSLDAIKDTFTSEAAYQLATGNFERASAVIESTSDLVMPSDISSIDSNRGNEVQFTNRVSINFETNLDLTLAENNPWGLSSFSPRALTEPGINKWLGNLLGDPTKICCTVHHKIYETTTSTENEIALANLNLHPIDFIYIIGDELETGANELEQRISYYYRNTQNIADDVEMKISFANTISTGSDVFTFAEIFPLAASLRKVLTNARAATAEDYQSASKDKSLDETNPAGIDIAELIARINAIFSDVKHLLESDLGPAITNFETTPSVANLDTVRAHLVKAANYGNSNAFPISHYGYDDSKLDDILTHIQGTEKNLSEALTEADALIIKAQASTEVNEQYRYITDAAKLLLGKAFVVMPQFMYNNPDDIQLAFDNRDEILKFIRDDKNVKLPVEEFISSSSKVRDNMGELQHTRLLNNALALADIDFEAMQIPYKSNDNWLAMELPPLAEGEQREILDDTISIVIHNINSFNAHIEHTALLIDDWTESIPEKESVTGITINYDQPNTEAAQTILLAVTPNATGKWSWNDLLNIINDTMERAKLRAVEPDQIDQSVIGKMLPSLISEFSTSPVNISLDLSLNVATLVQQIQAMQIVDNDG